MTAGCGRRASGTSGFGATGGMVRIWPLVETWSLMA
jgi:hypothetical protein